MKNKKLLVVAFLILSVCINVYSDNKAKKQNFKEVKIEKLDKKVKLTNEQKVKLSEYLDVYFDKKKSAKAQYSSSKAILFQEYERLNNEYQSKRDSLLTNNQKTKLKTVKK